MERCPAAKRRRRAVKLKNTPEKSAVGVGMLCSQDETIADEAEIEKYLLENLEKPSHLKELHDKMTQEPNFTKVSLEDTREILDVSSLVTQHDVPLAHFKPDELEELPSWICTTVYSSASAIDQVSEALPRMSVRSVYQPILAKIDELV